MENEGEIISTHQDFVNYYEIIQNKWGTFFKYTLMAETNSGYIPYTGWARSKTLAKAFAYQAYADNLKVVDGFEKLAKQ